MQSSDPALDRASSRSVAVSRVAARHPARWRSSRRCGAAARRGRLALGADPASVQPPVGAAAGHQHGDPGRGARLPVERDVADRHRATRLRAGRGQRVLHAQPGEPVAEVADGLVVVERGLPDPALRAGAADDETAGQLPVGLDGEAGVVHGLRAQHDPGGLGHRLRRAVRAHLPRPSRTPARAARPGSRWRSGSTGQPKRSSRSAVTISASSARVRHVDLVQRDQPGPVGQLAAQRRACSGPARPPAPRRRTPGRGRARRWRSRRRAPAPSSARCGAGSPARGRGPRTRPGSGPARRRR